MAVQEQQAIDHRLERAAVALGDIAGPVMTLFYARFPDARASFAHHSPRNPAALEAEMVGNTLYYVMNWFQNPLEARIYFDTSVPQHRVALNVSPDWYRGMIDALIDVIEAATPDADPDEEAAWLRLRAGLVGLVERNRFV